MKEPFCIYHPFVAIEKGTGKKKEDGKVGERERENRGTIDCSQLIIKVSFCNAKALALLHKIY